MKNITTYTFYLLITVFLWACKKDEYRGGVVSDYIGLFDVRNIYKDQDVVLSKGNMFGATKIAGVVVSDHSGNNLPKGLLMLEDMRRLSTVRGISVAIGDAAAGYVPGDSVEIYVEGSTLTRADGILTITNITNDAVQKVAAGRPVPVTWLYLNKALANPDDYESSLSVIVKANLFPLAQPGDVLSGDKVADDTYGRITIHIDPKAQFANNEAPFYSNYIGILLNSIVNGERVPQFRLRTGNDVRKKNPIVKGAAAIITGFMSDVVTGTESDANYEYIQFMATRDIDFAVTPFSVVTTNNAGTSTPIGFPANNWATGGVRTYKMNITTGKAKKGTFFYVGGSKKMINGINSTDISGANWVKAFSYGSAGEGFGSGTTNLLANSGNAFGMAIFEGTTVTAASVPIDVVFIGTGGTINGDNKGYPVGDNDYYDSKHPFYDNDQPFYRSGTNTFAFAYQTADLGIFNRLVGEYSSSLNRWTKVRKQMLDTLTKTSPLSVLESNTTVLKD